MMSLQFLCLKNIRTFLASCNTAFAMKKSDLFDAFDLFDVRDFVKVRPTPVFLSSLSGHTQQTLFAFNYQYSIINNRLCMCENMGVFGIGRVFIRAVSPVCVWVDGCVFVCTVLPGQWVCSSLSFATHSSLTHSSGPLVNKKLFFYCFIWVLCLRASLVCDETCCADWSCINTH